MEKREQRTKTGNRKNYFYKLLVTLTQGCATYNKSGPINNRKRFADNGEKNGTDNCGTDENVVDDIKMV